MCIDKQGQGGFAKRTGLTCNRSGRSHTCGVLSCPASGQSLHPTHPSRLAGQVDQALLVGHTRATDTRKSQVSMCKQHPNTTIPCPLPSCCLPSPPCSIPSRSRSGGGAGSKTTCEASSAVSTERRGHVVDVDEADGEDKDGNWEPERGWQLGTRKADLTGTTTCQSCSSLCGRWGHSGFPLSSSQHTRVRARLYRTPENPPPHAPKQACMSTQAHEQRNSMNKTRVCRIQKRHTVTNTSIKKRATMPRTKLLVSPGKRA